MSETPSKSDIGRLWLGPVESPATEAKRRQRILANLLKECPMPVRAKFHCNFKDSNVIQMSPVYSGSDENKAFFSATPGGQITLNVINPQAAEQFVQGKEYYVDFTPAAD